MTWSLVRARLRNARSGARIAGADAALRVRRGTVSRWAAHAGSVLAHGLATQIAQCTRVTRGGRDFTDPRARIAADRKALPRRRHVIAGQRLGHARPIDALSARGAAIPRVAALAIGQRLDSAGFEARKAGHDRARARIHTTVIGRAARAASHPAAVADGAKFTIVAGRALGKRHVSTHARRRVAARNFALRIEGHTGRTRAAGARGTDTATRRAAARQSPAAPSRAAARRSAT